MGKPKLAWMVLSLAMVLASLVYCVNAPIPEPGSLAISAVSHGENGDDADDSEPGIALENGAFSAQEKKEQDDRDLLPPGEQ